MFTGLVEDLGTVERLDRSPLGVSLWVRSALPHQELTLGESISHNGICLTVVQKEVGRFRVEVSLETLGRTTLGNWAPGRKLNLERALRLGARLGGHLVLGHVDGTGELVERRAQGSSEWLKLSYPTAMSPLFIEKGSVTVDGVSLTVNELFERTSESSQAFSVTTIPETRARTTLGTLVVGEQVNLEGDVIGKYIARLRGLETSIQSPGKSPGSPLTEEALRKAGFE